MAGDREFSSTTKSTSLVRTLTSQLRSRDPAYISGSSAPVWGRYGVTCVQGQGSLNSRHSATKPVTIQKLALARSLT